MKKILISFLLLAVEVKAESADVTSASSVTVLGSQSGSNTIAIQGDKHRKMLYIRNHHASEPIYLNFSANVSSTEGIKVAAASVYEPTNVPVDNIYLITGSSQAVSATVIIGK